MADPDFELRRGPGSILPSRSSFCQSFFFSFFTQKKGEARAPPLDPPLHIINLQPHFEMHLGIREENFLDALLVIVIGPSGVQFRE